MELSRTKTYNENKAFVQRRDNRTMDAICTNDSGKFTLQVQQEFMKKMVAKPWKHFLLYHGIGSGKTCTAITMAEEYLRLNPTKKITVILPARLKTNFLDELLSQCGFEKYISNDDFKRYNDPLISKSEVARIKKIFTAKIKDTYEIFTFEAFVLAARKAPDLKTWVTAFTKDRFIIIDEVHNMVNTNYKSEIYDQIVTERKISTNTLSGIRTLIFKYFVANSSEAHTKMVFMTATPVFDNIVQFKELVSIMSGVPKYEMTTLKQAIEHLRGMVSYFPGTSPNAYPSVKYVEENVKMSKIQEDLANQILDKFDNEDKPLSDAFMSKQRQVGIIAVPSTAEMTPALVNKIVSNVKEYAPKIKTILKIIRDVKIGKHLVYSNFVSKGLLVLEALLKSKGWVSYIDVLNDPSLADTHKYKVYVLWDGGLNDAHKQATKSKVNSLSNIDGKYIKVILGSPSIKEGVSFKHIQHLHMLDPVWNNSAKTQVEGRAIRFCSHSDIPLTSSLKREVAVHLYKSVPPEGSKIPMSGDQKIYNIIIPEKMAQVIAAEKALKIVAIDNYLFRNMYVEKDHSTPKTISGISELSISEDRALRKNKHATPKKIKKICPKKRRPDNNGNCPNRMIPRLNNHGELCCYKK